MPETVVHLDSVESQADADTSAEATPEAEDVATIKRRLAGKDQALTKAQQERDALKERLATLEADRKAREEADLSELELAKRREQEALDRAAAAERKATLLELQRKYPNALEALDGEILPEEKLAALESRLSKAATSEEDEDEPEPRVLGNRPRTAPASTGEPLSRVDQLKKQIAETPDEVFRAFMQR